MNSFLNALGSMMRQSAVQIRRHGPQIMIGAGVVAGIAGTVVACIETPKAIEIVKSSKEELNEIRKADINDAYTEKDKQKDITKTYAKTAGRLAKNYLPAIGLELGSVLLVLGGSNILSKKNAMLAASLTTMAGDFNNYRKRVVEKFGDDGEELDKEIRYGITKREEEVTIVEDGKEKKVKKLTSYVDEFENFNDGYIRMFEQGNPFWDSHPDFNMMFLRAKQVYFNDKLKADKFVYLNDVLIELGFEPTQCGHDTGWIYDENNTNGDNHIDFRVTPAKRYIDDDGLREFIYMNREEKDCGFLLDFNVDGEITSRVPWPDKKNKRLNGGKS